MEDSIVIKETREVALSAKPELLKRLLNQTEKEILIAVSKNGLCLIYAEIQTNEICVAAVKQNPGAICFVLEKTNGIYLEVLKKNPVYIKEIPREEQTEEMALIAVSGYWLMIKFVEQTENVCRAAVKKNPKALDLINKKFKKIIYIPRASNLWGYWL